VTDSYPVRAITPAQTDAFFAVIGEAFLGGAAPAEVVGREMLTFEFDRSAAAFDGSEMVGTSSAYSFDLSVPGGSAAASGITAVAVLPRYRRRGIMSAMIRHLLADAVRRGEPLAVLFASEPLIYRRFGFGCAAEELRFTIRRGEAGMTRPSGDPPLLRAAGPADALKELAAVYTAVAARRGGMPARDDRWWQYRTQDPESRRGGASPLRCVIAEDHGEPAGYALYTTTGRWQPDGSGIPDGILRIRELMADGPAAAAALWADLLSRDLVAEVEAPGRPVDDPLLHLLADRRRARPIMCDNLWLRVVDVPAALRQRAYARDVDIVLEVTDEVLPGNAGRWRLAAAAGGAATCERTTAAADIVVPAGTLGAAYLGGTRLGALVAAGQGTEVSLGAVAALSAAMSWDQAPLCPMNF
jgi:predicted acetyltransferase